MTSVVLVQRLGICRSHSLHRVRRERLLFQGLPLRCCGLRARRSIHSGGPSAHKLLLQPAQSERSGGALKTSMPAELCNVRKFWALVSDAESQGCAIFDNLLGSQDPNCLRAAAQRSPATLRRSLMSGRRLSLRAAPVGFSCELTASSVQ